MNKTKNIEDAYILSPMQQGMLFHSLYDSESQIYVEQFSYELQGELNISAFKNAWQQVVDRHSALRTAFVWQNIDRPHQIVGCKVKLPWRYYDWQGLNAEKQERDLAELLIGDRKKGFSLSRAPLMRLSLIHLEKERYQLIWSYHHLILDGWSVSLLLKEVMDFYQAQNSDRNISLAKPQPYCNYIAWLQQQNKSEAEAFWREQLTGFSSPTPLGVDCQTNIVVTEEATREEELKLSVAQTSVLKSWVKKHKITFNTLIQGLWGIILGCYSGDRDVVFGATSSGRPVALSGADETIGLFINTLPVRVDLDPEADLRSWLQQLQSKQFELRQYEHSSLSEIQQWSDIAKGTSLFESIVIFQNLPVDTEVEEWISSLKIRNLDSFQQTNYPLNIVVELNSNLSIKIDYDRSRFTSNAILRLLNHWQNLLDTVVKTPQAKLSELSLLTPAERHQLLVEWNDTEVEYPTDKCIHTLFEERVELTPDAVAVVFEDATLTYRELNDRANQLARYLQTKISHSQTVSPEILIGICLDRSLEMLVGMLGILKAGGAYIPIDPHYPASRIEYILKDAQISLLLTQSNLTAQLPPVETICLDTDWKSIATESTNNLNLEIDSNNLAYSIYTSGSTGKPKGVLIQHDSLVNFVCGAIDKYDITDKDRVLQFASISFDVAVEEIYPSLVTGGTIVLNKSGAIDRAAVFLAKMQQLQITVLDLPTAYWQQLVAEIVAEKLTLPESIRLVIIGGEQAHLKYVRQWQEYFGNTPQLINAYGPTEGTVETTIYPLSQDLGSRLPIGKPLPNVKVYVLNEYRQPVPIGVAGELYIGGAGVARGYLNRPELTKEKFIRDPFIALKDTASHRANSPSPLLYKTGDKVRYLNNGNLEFIGRIDNQVKVRGFRVELGEIENAIARHPGIDRNAVILYEDESANKSLAAYFTCDLPGSEALRDRLVTVTNSELREFLKSQLPNYAIPKIFVRLETLPLTTSGKIDRQSLPKPDLNQLLSVTNFVAPQTKVEKMLAQIWSQILGIEKIGINDNFFEVGGDSIVSIQIVAQANRVGLQLEPRQLFQHQTIAELARVARLNKVKSTTRQISLTPSQSLFLSQDRGNSNLCHLLSVAIDSTASPQLLIKALEFLIEYHDVFQIRFIPGESGWKQIFNRANISDLITQTDLSELAPKEQTERIASITKEVQTKSDLATTIPVRFILFDLGTEQDKLLLIVGNCLAVDRFSLQRIIEDLAIAYRQLDRGKTIDIPGKTISFQEWSKYLEIYARSEEIIARQDYWLAQTKQPFISLPTDFDSLPTKETETDLVLASLTPQETQDLLSKRLHNSYNTKVTDLLLTALGQTITKWTENPELWIDTINRDLPGSETLRDRQDKFNQIDISRTLGQFTNYYPVFFDFGDASNLEKALITVKEKLRNSVSPGINYGIFNHYESQSEIQSKLQALPQPEISFDYLDDWHQLNEKSIFKKIINDSLILASPLKSIYKIEIKTYISNKKLYCRWRYNKAIYRRETIELKAQNFMTILKDLIAHCLSIEEKRYTTSDFPQANLSQQNLDKFLAKINRVSK